jgi:RNA polymerase sigma-70 factor (ECF subfamily)
MELQSAECGQSLPVPSPSDFEAFVRAQREGLVCFLRRRTPLEEDAQDLAQESLFRLMRYREHAPTAWASLLYRIAINALNDRVRRSHTHREAQHTTLETDFAKLASPEPSHEQRIATQQELAALRGAMLGLPVRCRQIYLLNRIEDMSYAEIAEHCGISIKAVEKHISKALRLLRERLAPSWPTNWPEAVASGEGPAAPRQRSALPAHDRDRGAARMWLVSSDGQPAPGRFLEIARP